MNLESPEFWSPTPSPYVQAFIAVTASRHDAVQHIEQRRLSGAVDARGAIAMSLSRLEALHRHGRASLAGKVSRDEFVRILDCFKNEIFVPGTIDHMGSSLADDEGIASTKLSDKIDALSVAERYALADLVEQAYYAAVERGHCPFETAEELGLQFA